MYGESRFREMDEQLTDTSRDFNGSHSNDILAQTLLITASELNRIQKTREEEFKEVLKARHQYQVIFYHKGVQTLFAIYVLVKYHRYDSAHRDLRYLYETYFLIRGLNRNKDRAAEIVEEELAEIRKNDGDEFAEEDPVSVDKLFGIMREERKRAEESIVDLASIYHYLSNRSTHPVRMTGAALDGSHNVEEERQLLTFALYMAFGLTRELFRTYLDTPASDIIQRESQPIVKRFDEVLGKDVPVFLTDSYW